MPTTTDDTAVTQADQIRTYLELDPGVPRRVAEVAEAIGADDTRRLGSYLANMARRGAIARAGTGLYTSGPHRRSAAGDTTNADTTNADAGADRQAGARRSRTSGKTKTSSRRTSTRRAGGSGRQTAQARPAAATGTTPQRFSTAGSLDDGRLILRTDDDTLWLAEPMHR
jgi:hypothetical protein